MANIQKKNILKFISIPLFAVASLLINFEGATDTAYRDTAGIQTVCVGSTANGPAKAPIDARHVYTAQECARRLEADLVPTYKAVVKSIKVTVTDGETAAYTSFAYNVGIGAWNGSSALKLLNQGNHRAACDELPKWVYAGGVKVQGLVNRRAAERKLCIQGLPLTDVD
ncbi:lysozyme [Caballeronia sp. AZ1_KS37]|uniref:lysozyme n=1 Tax=Caballeronia sp. AZ1_KS37 TaxID=2921756 RepID=UPI002028A280|nr:lysozyme [Caballeronia sp. AZ1_KS37]